LFIVDIIYDCNLYRKPADEWPLGGVFASCQNTAKSPLHGDRYEIVGKITALAIISTSEFPGLTPESNSEI
jgi:hypothetical protein